MDAALREHVRQRAGNTCEYCRIHQDQDPFFTFPVDHIIARQHGGKTESENLCLSCYRCNSHKGPNIASIDPDTKELVRLFHPRQDKLERALRMAPCTHSRSHTDWSSDSCPTSDESSGLRAVTRISN